MTPSRKNDIPMAVMFGVVLTVGLVSAVLVYASTTRKKGDIQFESSRVDRGRIVARVTATGTVSALVTFEMFVRPALLRMQGRANVARPRAKARLVEPVDKIGSLRFFARGIFDPEAGTVRLTGPQGSGILRSMSLMNCLIDLPVGPSRIEKGELVDVILTEQPEVTR